MKDKIAWMLLSEKNRTNKKLSLLAKSFDTEKKNVDLAGSKAAALMNGIEFAAKKGCGLVTYMDEEYPDSLKSIANPPAYLYTRGNANLLKYPVKAAIVGSRDASAYGMSMALDFAQELSANKVCVVTGGAKGIDTAAIRGALHSGGKIIIAIGTGIDKDYPKENADLFEQVAQSGGLIVSELPVGMEPLPYNFPLRNRIITGVSDAVVVVEAAKRSGALTTASHAMEQGKMLFAVPGNIDSPGSVGTNLLLRDGALFALSPGDVVSSLASSFPDKVRLAQSYTDKPKAKALPKEEACAEEPRSEETRPEKIPTEEKTTLEPLATYEKAVVNAIKSGKDTYEEILEYTQMETNKLTSLLTIMEIKGIIKLAFGNRYKLIG